MEGTRTNVIAKINNWIDDVHSRNIFWLKGSPGAGKSTISATMVAQLRAESRLGSYFFFKSGHDALGNPINLWRTFSSDLAMFDPHLRTKILEALKTRRVDPSVPDINAHFQHLIREPLQSTVRSLSKYPVFIIDAVDECATSEHRKMFLETLKRWAELPCQLRLLLTSRDYHDIATALRSVSFSHVLRTGDLVDPNSDHDIRVYLSTHLQHIATSVEYDEILSPDWPGPVVIEELTKRAAGLFIWAATIVKLFEADIEEPDQQLSLILTNSSLSDIDNLYAQILDSAFGHATSHHINTFKLVVGGILAAKVPLGRSDLICFLGLDTLPALVLRKLRPVISSDTSDGCLRITHQSFADFVCDSERCPRQYVVDLKQANYGFATMCLNIMDHPNTGLRFNICDFPTSYFPNHAIPGLQSLVKTLITGCLLYSCCFWMDHLHASIPNGDLLQRAHQFIKSNFLYWLEALSLTKNMSMAYPSLQLLAHMCKVSTFH